MTGEFYQCTNCPTGPCTMHNIDPEFEPAPVCMDKRYYKTNTAAWKMLEPLG